MTKQELDKLTRHESTWEEFTAIERIYMAREDMTKEDAAKLWKKCFFEVAAKREAKKAELVQMKLQHNISPLDNPLQIREVRKTIARLATEIRQRELTNK